ncbi:MAG TPA: primosomal protein N' [Alphaproteobacteria bacterium]|nr:primosomal protein N' [Alphaproteobacteria bacterium]
MPDSETSRTELRTRVLLPLPLAGAYDYRSGAEADVRPGEFVRVPLGGRYLAGVVWDGPASSELPESRLKAIAARLDVPPMPEEMRRFIDWVAAYTMSPPGAVLRMAMSVPAAFEPPRPSFAVRQTDQAPHPDSINPDDRLRLTAARRRVLRELVDQPPRPVAEIARAAGVGTGVVRSLIELGWLELVEAAPPPARIAAPPAGPVLSADQADAAATLCGKLAQGFSVTLLDGVTGSGKTEVYFEAIAANMAAGRQSLVLLPEIALSAQWFARYQARFGSPPAVWHSEIGQAERRRAWRAVAAGEAAVVVGARSALFLPFARLGLIVIDEEHDPAFKQEDGVIYHARDMAVVRARFAKVPVVLVSATPSLETAQNVERGRYAAVHLPERHGGAALPEIRTIDLRRDPPPRGAFLSPPLREAVQARLAAGEQAMLFLNRRGYAPLTLCRACGHRVTCPNCTSWLVEHRRTGRLLCHHCGHSEARPMSCSACGAADSFVPCGPGVERVAEEAASLFEGARVAIVTSDTIAGPHAAEAFVRRMIAGEIDLLIGTQVIAKGHHFPKLTLVGVVDADLGLTGGDLRASERTYQLLHQVAGRAGRAERPGLALLQTYAPEHPVMKALVGLSRDSAARDRFLAAEADERQRAGWPPFGRLAAVIVSGPDAHAVDAVARRLGATAPHGNGVEVLGPAPAPLALLRGRHRRRLLVKARRDADLQGAVGAWLDQVKPPANVRLQIDIEPYSFL